MTRKIYGRTLLELMYALAIVAILLSVALPNFRDMTDRNARTQSVNQMVSLLHHIRSQAVFARGIVTLCPGTTQCVGSQHWQGDLLLFLDHNGNGLLDGQDRLLHQAKVATNHSWRWNRSNGYIQYEPDGTTRALNGTLTLCRGNEPQHQLVIALSGRVRQQRPVQDVGC